MKKTSTQQTKLIKANDSHLPSKSNPVGGSSEPSPSLLEQKLGQYGGALRDRILLSITGMVEASKIRDNDESSHKASYAEALVMKTLAAFEDLSEEQIKALKAKRDTWQELGST